MSPTLKTLGIDQMTVTQRILLVEEIWDSIVAEEIWDSIAVEAEDLPLSEAQQQDLRRRIAAYETNPKAGSSWEEVKARLLEQP